MGRRGEALRRGAGVARAPNTVRFPQAASAVRTVADRCPGRRLYPGLDGSVRRIPGERSGGHLDALRADYKKQALRTARDDRSWSSVSRRDDHAPAHNCGFVRRTEASAAYRSGEAEAKNSAPNAAAAPLAGERLGLASRPERPPPRELELVGQQGSMLGSQALWPEPHLHSTEPMGPLLVPTIAVVAEAELFMSLHLTPLQEIFRSTGELG